MPEQTTPLDTAALQDAERRWPSIPRTEGESLRGFARAGSKAGARWGVERAEAEVRRLTAALAKANAAAVAAYDGNGLIQQANAHRDWALDTLREIAEVMASGDDVSRTVRGILIREGLYEPPAADPVVEAFEAGDPGRALERMADEEAAAMREALRLPLAEALGDDG